jgi:hypothetical protein
MGSVVDRILLRRSHIITATCFALELAYFHGKDAQYYEILWSSGVYLLTNKVEIVTDNNIVTCRPISRQRPKYAHATIEPMLQEQFSM